MWYSPRFKALFVHVPKTGGTSVRRLFDQHDAVKSYGNHLMLPQAGLFIEDQREVFTFGFVRNPFSLLVSLYTYLVHVGSPATRGKSFEQWLMWREEAGRVWTQTQFFQGKVDFIGRFETFDEDLARVCAQLGVPYAHTHVNSTQHDAWESYYTPKMKRYVRKQLSTDFKKFGYVDKA